MQESPPEVLARLVPEVRAYRMTHFVLEDDLARLDRVQRVGAAEAVVLYCARILEALAREAVRQVGQTPTANTFANLQILEHLNRLGTATCCWAHALRRTGNAVRHLTGPVGAPEADVSTLFAERWLDWFFCRFSHGQRLSDLTGDRGPLGLAVGEELRRLVQVIEAFDAAGPGTTVPPDVAPWTAASIFRRTPTLAAVLAEILLSRNRLDEAEIVLTTGLGPFPNDLRLRQLMGLYWKRRGDPERALAELVPLYAKAPDDAETAGITAGAFKEQWLRNRADGQALDQAHRAYRKAWKSSKRENAYLGINSATTALWLGQRDEARRLAREVEALLRRRAAGLPADLAGLAHNFWDQVTLAEAQLLQGDRAAAQRSYDAAFARHADRRGDIEVSEKQRDEILKALARQQAVVVPSATA